MSEKPTVLDLREEDLRAFVVKNGLAYLKVLAKLKRRQRLYAFSFSWAAFLFPLSWLAYRRLWGWLIAAVALSVGLALVEWVLDLDFYIQGFVIAAFFAVNAKHIILGRAVAAVSMADELSLVGDDREAFLNENGGVSIVGAWISSLLQIALFGASLGFIFWDYGA